METTRLTAADFDMIADLTENQDKLLEFIGGEIVEVPSNPQASKYSGLFITEFNLYVRANDIGHVTGEAGGYMVSGERYAPDAAFISYARQPQLAASGYNPNPPELAVEIDFPSSAESRRQLMIKVANYLAAGTTVWVARPAGKQIEVYAPGKPVQILGVNDTLDGGTILPGFTLAVKAVFA